jgi:hypothetical protein
MSNDQANGKGNLYFPDGQIEYEGQFYANLLHGRGVLYSESGYIIYHGEFVNGLRAGYGVEYYVSGGVMYQGQWNSDKWNGNGSWHSSIGELNYEGLFVNGEPQTGKFFFLMGLDLKWRREFKGESNVRSRNLSPGGLRVEWTDKKGDPLVRSFAVEPVETEDWGVEEDAPIVLERPMTAPSEQGPFFFLEKNR